MRCLHAAVARQEQQGRELRVCTLAMQLLNQVGPLAPAQCAQLRGCAPHATAAIVPGKQGGRCSRGTASLPASMHLHGLVALVWVEGAQAVHEVLREFPDQHFRLVDDLQPWRTVRTIYWCQFPGPQLRLAMHGGRPTQAACSRLAARPRTLQPQKCRQESSTHRQQQPHLVLPKVQRRALRSVRAICCCGRNIQRHNCCGVVHA